MDKKFEKKFNKALKPVAIIFGVVFGLIILIALLIPTPKDIEDLSEREKFIYYSEILNMDTLHVHTKINIESKRDVSIKELKQSGKYKKYKRLAYNIRVNKGLDSKVLESELKSYLVQVLIEESPVSAVKFLIFEDNESISLRSAVYAPNGKWNDAKIGVTYYDYQFVIN